jgi:hypothetical protein
MIHAAALSGYYPVSDVLAAHYSSGKLAVPVLASQAPYAYFEHVVGVPASEPGEGVPLERLKILDSLISQLENAKKEPVPEPAVGRERGKSRIDALIEQYKKEIHAVASSPRVSLPYKPAIQAPRGLFINMVA